MKKIFVIACVLLAVTLYGLWSAYVYVGTYILPIAPYWVTQLPPNPPSPKIKKETFEFRLTYKINGKQKTITDSTICSFEGFKVIGVGGPKKRIYSQSFSGENETILFQGVLVSTGVIVIENIGDYKITLGISSPDYLLGDPDSIPLDKEINIQVYSAVDKNFLEPIDEASFLDAHTFSVIDWQCKDPITNNFPR